MIIGVIIRYSNINESIILYDMSTDCAHLKKRVEELNNKPTYMHPFEGHEFKYIYSSKRLKELNK